MTGSLSATTSMAPVPQQTQTNILVQHGEKRTSTDRQTSELKPSLQTSSQLESSDSESSKRREKERKEQEKRHKREKDKEERLREAIVDIDLCETETFTLLSLYNSPGVIVR